MLEFPFGGKTGERQIMQTLSDKKLKKKARAARLL